ncbi:MAG TPA: NAD-dependent epimerase/dehydratase family protein [Miltoncostaeaceae bacterium]|nr:NAD-dependent epimerase/dehydratase family protein [Miltoncostaeaceae bacterium]
MRVVITGATGNVGTALVRALLADERVERIVGIARRAPDIRPRRTTWEALDVARDDLRPAFDGADAVVHLAWEIQPSRDLRALWRTNVLGSRRVFDAAAEAGAGALVHASSVGVYSPGPKDRAVDESWPREGTPTSDYAVHKAEAERRLDQVERAAPGMRVVRMRPGLCFSREAATGVRRLFAGHLLPARLVRPSRIPRVPDIPGLRFQAVHSDDVAQAYRLAITKDVSGPFNVAAEPVLDPPALAEALGARTLFVPAGVARRAISLTWRLRLQPTGPGWLDMALAVPVMDAARARRELGWAPRQTSAQALTELLDGMADRAGAPTPPLAPRGGGPMGAVP